MLIAHKIALKANNKQKTYFARAAGTARFAYNWALTEWRKQYEAHKALLHRVQFLSKSLSRKTKGSNNRKKAQMKLARLHARIRNIRNDNLHNLTTNLTRHFHTIVIEDLNVKGMMKNRHLSRAIADLGFFEFRRQLEYKAKMRGNVIIVADRWFASSKICSCCSYKLESLSLATRQWRCPVCCTQHERDLNAAINLKSLAVSSTVSVCGEASSGFNREIKTKLASVKQKSKTIATYR